MSFPFPKTFVAYFSPFNEFHFFDRSTDATYFKSLFSTGMNEPDLNIFPYLIFFNQDPAQEHWNQKTLYSSYILMISHVHLWSSTYKIVWTMEVIIQFKEATENSLDDPQSSWKYVENMYYMNIQYKSTLHLFFLTQTHECNVCNT